MMLLEDYPSNTPEVHIVWMGEESEAYAFGVADKLRGAGIKTNIEFVKKSMKASMKKADKLGVSYAIIIGDQELAENKVVLKNLAERTQETLSVDEAIAELLK